MDKFRILFFGTIFSQFLLIILLPYFTSIYSPKSFSELALLNSICVTMYPIISGRLNFALLSLDNGKKVEDLLKISFIYIYLIASLFIFLLLFFFYFADFNNQSSFFFIKLFFFLVFFSQTEMILAYFNRFQNYFLMSSLKVSRTIFLLLMYYLFQFREDGIVLSNILSFGVIIIISTLYFKIDFWNNLKNLSFKFLSDFKDFLYFNALTNSLSGLIISMPVFYINTFHGNDELGAYSLFLMIVAGPLSMIGKTVSQYNVGQIISLKKNDSKSLIKYFLNLLRILFLLCLVFYFSVALFNVYLFDIFFDSQWSLSSSIISILSLGFIFQFLGISLSSSLEVLGYVNRSSKFRIIMFLSNISIHFYAYFSSLSFLDYIKILTIEKIIIYSFITILTYKSVKDFTSK